MLHHHIMHVCGVKHTKMTGGIHQYPIYNSESMTRKLKDLQELCKSKKDMDNFGSINEPLLDIELTHVVSDELHLLLRVTDVLLTNVVIEAMDKR